MFAAEAPAVEASVADVVLEASFGFGGLLAEASGALGGLGLAAGHLGDSGPSPLLGGRLGGGCGVPGGRRRQFGW